MPYQPRALQGRSSSSSAGGFGVPKEMPRNLPAYSPASSSSSSHLTVQAGARLVHGSSRRLAGRDALQAEDLERWQRAAPQPRGQVSAAIVGDLGAVEFDLSWLTSCRAVVAAAAAVAAHTNGFKCFDSSVVPPRRLGLQFSRPMRGHVAHQGVRHSFFATLRTARWVQTSLRGGGVRT